MNIPIVYEDDWLLIVDKPSGLLVIPTPHNEKRTLNSILNDDLKSKSCNYRLHPCHRLDRETSGLIIYAKGKSAQDKMMDEFKNRRIYKTYVAFVQGVLPVKNSSINLKIDGKSALTNYSVIEQRNNFAYLKVNPVTGRKNQIRIHFKSIGHPLVGESRFSFRKDYALKAKRALLHAYALDFMHPWMNKKIHLESELPQDMRILLTKGGG